MKLVHSIRMESWKVWSRACRLKPLLFRRCERVSSVNMEGGPMSRAMSGWVFHGGWERAYGLKWSRPLEQLEGGNGPNSRSWGWKKKEV